MFGSLKKDLEMLRSSKRNIIIFEITYKLAATAIIYPCILFLLHYAMKFTGVKYLTNEYIATTLTNPIVIIFIILGLIFLALYCFFEMSFLVMCFEGNRKKSDATIFQCVYTAVKEFFARINIKNIWAFLFELLIIVFINVAVFCNILYSQTIVNLLKTAILYTGIFPKVLFILGIITIYVFVIRGVFVFNIFFLEKENVIEAYKKSASMVKKHLFGVIYSIVMYNICVIAFIGVVYVILSAVLIAGVKFLDMAYMGSTIYLSMLRYIRKAVKFFMVYTCIPISFAVITRRYYKYADIDNIKVSITSHSEKRHDFNKFIYYIVLFASIIINTIYVVKTFNKNPFDKIAVFHETNITAHRGGALLAPENTLAAFDKAISNRVDYIELDVRQTRDGEIVIMHDANAKRTTGVDRYISDMTLDEVKRLDAGSFFSKEYAGEQVPTLQEVLELTKGKVKLNIEIKTSLNDSDIAGKVVKIIQEYEAQEDCEITSFDYNTLKKIKEYDENIKTGYILSVAYGTFYDTDEVDFFSMNASFLSKRLIDAIHKSGKEVYALTVNNEISIKNLSNKGVDNIITDEYVIAKETVLSRDTAETLVNMARYVFNR